MAAPPAEPAAPETTERAAPAAETVRLYRADWRAFETWCAAEDLAALPATPDTVARFLAARPALSAGTLARRAAAIAAHHRQRGLAAPTEDAAVTAWLRQARRAATAVPGRNIAAPVPADPDGAVLPARSRRAARSGPVAARGAAPGRAGPGRPALGRAALVGLAVEQLRFTATGVELILPGDDAYRRRGTLPGRADQ